MNVFIAGSRALSRLNAPIRDRIDDLLKRGCTILVGDANGADKAVVATPSRLEREIGKTRRLLHHAAIDRARRYEHVRMIRLLNGAEKLRDRHWNPEGYRGAEADKAENAYLDQRDRAMRVEGTVPDPTALLVIDEADRREWQGCF